MKYHIKITFRPKAIQDLEDIYKYSEKNFGYSRAVQYVKDIDIALNKIIDNPALASDYSDIRFGLSAYKVVSHIIFFKLSKQRLTVIRILHQSMDYKRYL